MIVLWDLGTPTATGDLFFPFLSVTLLPKIKRSPNLFWTIIARDTRSPFLRVPSLLIFSLLFKPAIFFCFKSQRSFIDYDTQIFQYYSRLRVASNQFPFLPWRWPQDDDDLRNNGGDGCGSKTISRAKSLSSRFYLLLASRRSYFVALSLSANLSKAVSLESRAFRSPEPEYQKCVFTSVPVHKATSRLILIHSPLPALSHARIRPYVAHTLGIYGDAAEVPR